MKAIVKHCKVPKELHLPSIYPVYRDSETLDKALLRMSFLFNEFLLREFEEPILVGRGSSGVLLAMGVYARLNVVGEKPLIHGVFPLRKHAEDATDGIGIYRLRRMLLSPSDKVRPIVLVDDFCSTGTTIYGMVRDLGKEGLAPSAVAFASGIFRSADTAFGRMEESAVVKVYVATNNGSESAVYNVEKKVT